LHVRIAHSGLCSRRAAEKLIREGRVDVNGEQVREMGVLVGPDDTVHVDGVKVAEAKLYTLLLNKPKGVVTTLSDPGGRPTIVRYLPDFGVQLKPVGRLDMDTEGLLLVTNDGELANRLMHPRYGVEKEYIAVVRGVPEEKSLDRLRKGVHIEDGKTAPAKVELLPTQRSGSSSSMKIILHEGRKRQVRQMCDVIGHPVISLKRVRIGQLYLKGMRGGECKLLSKLELAELRRMVGLE
jgi:pseudouridine synthase